MNGLNFKGDVMNNQNFKCPNCGKNDFKIILSDCYIVPRTKTLVIICSNENCNYKLDLIVGSGYNSNGRNEKLVVVRGV